MYSVDFQEIEVLQHQDKWEELTAMMIDAGEKLRRGGADFIVICTNTMHKMAEDIEKAVGLKVLHIAEATGEEIIKSEIKKVGLIGTKFTMEGDFYKKVLKDKYNVDVIIPEDEDREIIHNVIYDELCRGEINSESKEKYKKIIARLDANGAEGIVLGCTEIPLLIKQEDVNIKVFDTTTIHGISAAEFAISTT